MIDPLTEITVPVPVSGNRLAFIVIPAAGLTVADAARVARVVPTLAIADEADE